MAVKAGRVIEVLEGRLPPALAEEWDRVGLVVGDRAQPLQRIGVALDLTDAVLEAAVAQGIDFLLLHHSPLFHPLRRVHTGSREGARLVRLLTSGITVYVAHTNWDKAPFSTGDVLAQALGLQAIRPLFPDDRESFLKIAVFVPPSHLESVRQAMAEAGAGFIGNYSHCFFGTPGEGTFLPREGARPFIGTPGELERVSEIRLESILPAARAGAVLSAMQRAHPYEEVAYDLYPLANRRPGAGLGRMGKLPQPIPLRELAQRVLVATGATFCRRVGEADRPVQRVAVLTGAGGEMISRLPLSVDAYVTGDVKYHQAQEAMDRGIAVLDAGHFATEEMAMKELSRHLPQWLQEAGVDLPVLFLPGEEIFQLETR